MNTIKLAIPIKCCTLLLLTLAGLAFQEPVRAGFVISLKNGSTIRGRTLARDEASGKLRLTMTESGSEPKSYAIIAMDDAESIRASTAEADSIRIRVKGGSELRCREFRLLGDVVSVKVGSQSRVDVPWDQIESISFESP
jgi:hypothetical protein